MDAQRVNEIRRDRKKIERAIEKSKRAIERNKRKLKSLIKEEELLMTPSLF